ncbi:hypothetical protein COU58_01170 [Candidatus Pacearchaeota archaeon CG10_big_fil_rev_8_21_14_0_10_32_42]|nr:MAG: hypothetical protein COU58_01170 [Candidatus Pacearchaeota archaeon CG10_big_fil_rev_8_21_14_0_10_32_42]
MKVNLIKRISERTGLKNVNDVFAYIHFCKSVDFEDGVILFGNVQHDFYEDASKILKSKKNYELKSEVLSRYSKMAYNHFLKLFISRGLVSEPRFVRKDVQTKYPVLSSYNFFNDSEIYIPYRKNGEERWTGRFPKEGLTDEERSFWKSHNYEFKF